METLTITLDDSAADRVRTVARKHSTTVEFLFTSFVASLSTPDTGDNDAEKVLASTFQNLSRPLGGKCYTNRDELYER